MASGSKKHAKIGLCNALDLDSYSFLDVFFANIRRRRVVIEYPRFVAASAMKTLPALTLFAFIMLAGCATPYGPHQLAGGYSNVRIQNDEFRIVFDGNGFIHKSAVEYFALVRAAELTVPNGRDYFRVLGGDADVRTINVLIPGQTFHWVLYRGGGSQFDPLAELPFYADRVDYFDNGIVNRGFIAQDIQNTQAVGHCGDTGLMERLRLRWLTKNTLGNSLRLGNGRGAAHLLEGRASCA